MRLLILYAYLIFGVQFANDCLSRGHSSHFARAGFRILVDNGDMLWDHDVCKLQSITMDEYVAFRLCLPPHYPPDGWAEECPASEDILTVKDLLRQWHLRLVFYSYDSCGSGGGLLPADVSRLATDLAHQQENVHSLATLMTPFLNDETRLTLEGLSCKEMSGVLEARHCSLFTLLAPSPPTVPASRSGLSLTYPHCI